MEEALGWPSQRAHHYRRSRPRKFLMHLDEFEQHVSYEELMAMIRQREYEISVEDSQHTRAESVA